MNISSEVIESIIIEMMRIAKLESVKDMRSFVLDFIDYLRKAQIKAAVYESNDQESKEETSQDRKGNIETCPDHLQTRLNALDAHEASSRDPLCDVTHDEIDAAEVTWGHCVRTPTMTFKQMFSSVLQSFVESRRHG